MDQENDEKILSYAVRLTSRGEYTCMQVLKKLLAKGASDGSAEAICSQLKESGMIDDARYCEQFASTHPDLGFARVRMELLKRGVDRTVIEERLAFDPEVELARAVALAMEWSSFADGRKIAGRLSRRGFSSSAIRDAVRRACDDRL
ncbi:MAG: regulatory protein RecX [Thermovirgaceae bacterium]|nr:regulatory protein RecX [Thermovirgaceae bacterium]